MANYEYYDRRYSYENHELKDWWLRTDEERSWIVKELYRLRAISSEEIEPFMRATRMSTWATLAYPLIAYPLFDYTIWSTNFVKNKLNKAQNGGFKFFTMAVTWTAWVNFNPFYLHMYNEKERMLEIGRERGGSSINYLVQEMLPRTMTCNKIHRMIYSEYNKRHSLLTGTLYNGETSAEPILSEQNMKDW